MVGDLVVHGYGGCLFGCPLKPNKARVALFVYAVSKTFSPPAPTASPIAHPMGEVWVPWLSYILLAKSATSVLLGTRILNPKGTTCLEKVTRDSRARSKQKGCLF